jgi:hypothetical protein
VPSSNEIVRGTTGAIKFLQRDASAPFHFENTVEYCLRSFRVMLVVAPIYGLYLAVYYSSVSVQADEVEIFCVETLRYIVDWLLYPVIFYEIARRRNWLDRYPRYIAALNWTNLPAVILALGGLTLALLAPPSFATIIDLVLRALFFYWFMMVTRMVLGVSWLLTVLLTVVNWIPSLFLSLIVTRFLGVTPLPG